MDGQQQLTAMESLQRIYKSLSPFFKLLFVYDLEAHSESKLKELASALTNNAALTPSLQTLFSKLEEASQKNITEKIRKKKESQALSKLARSNQADVSRLDESNVWEPPHNNQSAFDESLTFVNESRYIEPKTNYKELERKSGKIFGGTLLATFALSDLKKIKKVNAHFKIDPKKQESTISHRTLTELGLNSTNPTLLVDDLCEKFALQTENILGLSFLQGNKILMQCNYRPAISSFKMTFTE